MDVRRAVVIQKDDETQIPSTMGGRHVKNNPSDGLFKKPTQQGSVGRLDI